MRLILINYSTNPSSLVFSHQRETLLALTKHFESIHVFTPDPSSELLPDNVKVSKIAWKQNSVFVNAFRLYKSLIPTLIKSQNVVVFSHMTDVHAALISPLTWILRIRHVLWYAHATNSIYLVWSSFFVSQIVSSTKGSCNLRINRGKVRFINQGISKSEFPFISRDSFELTKFFYYGRLDPSKNIHLLLELVKQFNDFLSPISIDIYGNPAKSNSTKYLENLKTQLTTQNLNSQFKFRGPIKRASVSNVARDYGVFINLFTGSLDKTLIEATFLGIPVITWNEEYCAQFGTWSAKPAKTSLNFIIEEIQSLKKLHSRDIQTEIYSRQSKAIESHAFEDWIERLVCVLKEKGK